jgi:hypothetical protein
MLSYGWLFIDVIDVYFSETKRLVYVKTLAQMDISDQQYDLAGPRPLAVWKHGASQVASRGKDAATVCKSDKFLLNMMLLKARLSALNIAPQCLTFRICLEIFFDKPLESEVVSWQAPDP